MNGILIVDKPSGITSYQVVKKVRNIFKTSKVGHGGTLDPLATGVLPIFLNKATKLVPVLMNGTKRYRATMKLGIETDTQDRDGKITAENNCIPEDYQLIDQIFNSFKGTIEQIPPMFSALKVQGTPLYKLARKGISLDLKARRIFIHEIKVIDISLPHVTFEVCCSSGTYVRTLCADAGKKLGCGAHLTELRRLKSGNFLLDDSIDLDQLNLFAEQNSLKENLFSLSKSFSTLPGVMVDNQAINILKKSGAVSVSHLKNNFLPPIKEGGFFKATCPENNLIAIVQSLISTKRLHSIPHEKGALKLVCFFNPHENTIH